MALQRLIPQEPPAEGLSDEEARRVLNYAIALTLSEDTVQVIDLNKRYGDVMAETAFKDTFHLLVDDVDGRGFRSIAEGLGQVESVQAFMSSYRQRLQQSSLSALN